jgi:hypothetical protein
MKNRLINILLFFTTLCVGLISAEGVFRLIYDEVDVLSPMLVDDEILGYRIEPLSGGHDHWGYRNRSVPGSADIVFLGDSQTWGVNASLEESFPYQVAAITGRSVYSFAVSGYGPMQYRHLLMTRVMKLQPKHVVVALYPGNDFDDSFQLVYRKDYWNALRKTGFAVQEKVEDASLLEQTSYTIKYWLNHHSVFYRVAKSRMEFLISVVRGPGDRFVHYVNDERGIEKYFNPVSRLSVIDSKDQRILEGLRLSLVAIDEMSAYCRDQNIGFSVIIIPTDISVYAAFLYGNKALPHSETFSAVIDSEEELFSVVDEFLNSKSILYVNVLDSLQARVDEPIYRRYEDGHPSAYGYRIIARCVAEHLTADSVIYAH